jgi:hypothetical protein
MLEGASADSKSKHHRDRWPDPRSKEIGKESGHAAHADERNPKVGNDSQNMDLIGSGSGGRDARPGPHDGVRGQPVAERLRRPGRGRTGDSRLDADRGIARRRRRWIVGLWWLGRSEPLRLGGSIEERYGRDVIDRLGIGARLGSGRRECRLGLTARHFQRGPCFAHPARRTLDGRARWHGERLRLPQLAGLRRERLAADRHIARRRAPTGWDPRHARAGGGAHLAAFPATEPMTSDR